MTYDVEKEIAAIGTCMEAVRELELSEALRVLAYVSDFIGVKPLSNQAYKLSARARIAEAAEAANETTTDE